MMVIWPAYAEQEALQTAPRCDTNTRRALTLIQGAIDGQMKLLMSFGDMIMELSLAFSLGLIRDNRVQI